MYDRSTLKAHWTLDPAVTFLNHGSFGACPRAVQATQQSFRDQMEREPVAFFLEAYPQALGAAKDRLGAFLGCSADTLVFIRNTTEGVNSILGSMPWAAGDEIVVTNLTYPACLKAVGAQSDRFELRIHVVDIDPDWEDDTIVAAMESALTSRTRLVLFDHITSATGLVLPAQRVVDLCKDRDVRCAIDGAHAPGMLPLEIEKMAPDFYVGNLHKWCCAPKGAAFLYAADSYRQCLRPTSISHGYDMSASVQDISALFDWPGTHDPSAWFSVPAALDFIEALHPRGLDALRAETVELRRKADALIGEVLPTLSRQTHRTGWMTTFKLPDTDQPPLAALDIDPFQRMLNKQHRIQVPVTAWPSWPKRVIRFSVAPYNVLDDYRHLRAALEQILGETYA